MAGEYEVIPAAQMYSTSIIRLWLDCKDLSREFRVRWLRNEPDKEIAYAYIAALTSMWGELAPKLKGRNDIPVETRTEFDKYQTYYRNPTLLMDGDHAEDIVRIEESIRAVLEVLKLTKFEGGI